MVIGNDFNIDAGLQSMIQALWIFQSGRIRVKAFDRCANYIFEYCHISENNNLIFL